MYKDSFPTYSSATEEELLKRIYDLKEEEDENLACYKKLNAEFLAFKPTFLGTFFGHDKKYNLLLGFTTSVLFDLKTKINREAVSISDSCDNEEVAKVANIIVKGNFGKKVEKRLEEILKEKD